MNVLIAGGGRTGARLANLLIDQNYKVCLIENRRELLGYVTPGTSHRSDL